MTGSVELPVEKVRAALKLLPPNVKTVIIGPGTLFLTAKAYGDLRAWTLWTDEVEAVLDVLGEEKIDEPPPD